MHLKNDNNYEFMLLIVYIKIIVTPNTSLATQLLGKNIICFYAPTDCIVTILGAGSCRTE